MAAPPFLPAAPSRRSARQEGVKPAVPLACGLQHAAGGAVEPAAADHPLAQAGVPDGLRAQSAAPPARPHHVWQCEGQEEAATGVREGRGDLQVFSLQQDGKSKMRAPLQL